MSKSILTLLLAVAAWLGVGHAPGLPVMPTSPAVQSVWVNGARYDGLVRLGPHTKPRLLLRLQGVEGDRNGMFTGRTRIWVLGPEASNPPVLSFEANVHAGEADVARTVQVPYLDAEYRVVMTLEDSHGNRETRSVSVHP